MTKEPSSQPHCDKVWIINAVCLNCNKWFSSMRAVSMHLRMTGTRHAVNFINHGDYDRKTGLREMSHPELHIPSRKMSSVDCRRRTHHLLATIAILATSAFAFALRNQAFAALPPEINSALMKLAGAHVGKVLAGQQGRSPVLGCTPFDPRC
jgi:hypothetical protein